MPQLLRFLLPENSSMAVKPAATLVRARLILSSTRAYNKARLRVNMGREISIRRGLRENGMSYFYAMEDL